MCSFGCGRNNGSSHATRLVIAFPYATIVRFCYAKAQLVINCAKSSTLPIAFRLLNILLAAIPALALTDDWLVRDVTAIAAASLLLLAAGASERDLKISVQLLRQIRVAMLVPVIWMLLQFVPLNLFSNSIWPTASVALNEPLTGHISIDPDATIRALFAYLTAVSLMVATVVFTRDRERAEITLFVTCAVTTFMSVEILLGKSGILAGIVPAPERAFATLSALGAVVNTAAAVRIVERHLSRPEDARAIASILMFGLGLAAAATCLVAIGGRPDILIAAAFGMAVVLLVGISRFVALRPWGAAALFAILALAAAGITAVRFQDNTAVMASLRFATGASADSLSVSQRALSDATWLGSGAGTFDTLVPIYREFGGMPTVEPASTFAKIAIEWGRGALIVVVLITVQLFVVMFRGALRRGRDWFFAAAGSGCVLVLFCEAFCDSSLTHPSNQIIAAVIIGLGISQTKGRTSGL